MSTLSPSLVSLLFSGERRGYVINPNECAERIVRNDPDLAKELFDLLLWAADQTDIKDNEKYDEIMGNLYKRLQHCRNAREDYAKARLQRVVLPDSTAAAGSN